MYVLQCPPHAKFGNIMYFQLYKFLFQEITHKNLALSFNYDNAYFSTLGMDSGTYPVTFNDCIIPNISSLYQDHHDYHKMMYKDFTPEDIYRFINKFFSHVKNMDPIPEDTLVLHLRSNDNMHKETHFLDIPSFLDKIPFHEYKNVIVVSKDEYMARNWMHGRNVNWQFHHSNDLLEDFYFMARAKSLAITTSTMGYWAAYIASAFFNAKIFCPHQSPLPRLNLGVLLGNSLALPSFNQLQTFFYSQLLPIKNVNYKQPNGCIVMLVTKPFFRYLFRSFYENLNKYMTPNVDVLVYTDDASDPVFDVVKNTSLPFYNRIKIQQREMPSDYQELLWDKWEIFNQFFDENPQYDHIYHFNVNVLFGANINLPSLTDKSKKEGFLTLHMTEHIYNFNHYKFFKDDMDACCYINPDDIHYYYFGGYVSMSREQYKAFFPIVKEWMDKDKANGKFHSALYRDETYYNKFWNLSRDQQKMDIFPLWYLRTTLVNKIPEFEKYFTTQYNPHDILIVDKPRGWKFYGLKDGDETYALIEYNKRIKKVQIGDGIYRLDFLNDDEKPLVVKQDANNPLLFSNEEILDLQAHIQSQFN